MVAMVTLSASETLPADGFQGRLPAVSGVLMPRVSRMAGQSSALGLDDLGLK
jgi:hypothetical protein